MMRTETETFGVSMSTGCVRGVVMDPEGRVVEVRSLATGSDRPLFAAAAAAIEMAADLCAGPEAPVIAVGGDPENTYGPGGVRLVAECDALLAAARMEGCVDDARTLAIVDLGRVGTRVHVLDTQTGDLFSSVGISELSGDAIDAAVADHLSTTFGAAEKMSPAAVRTLARDSLAAKEMLSDERAVDLSGPFVTDSVRLRRTDVELLIADSTATLVDLVDDAVARGADAVLLVGGGAHIPSVRRDIAARVAVPVITPRWPQFFAAMGAAHLSTVVPASVGAAPLPVVVAPPADDEVTAAFTTVAEPAHTPAAEPAHTPDPEVAPEPGTARPPLRTPRTATGAPRRARSTRRRRSRAGVVVGTTALVAAVTLGAAAGASGRSEIENVQATDRVVVTSSVDATPTATTVPAAAPSVDAAPSSASESSSTVTPGPSTTTTTGTTVVSPSTVTPSTSISPRPTLVPAPSTAAQDEPKETQVPSTTRRPNPNDDATTTRPAPAPSPAPSTSAVPTTTVPATTTAGSTSRTTTS
ncbi:Hsp70 family protein [Rhodococcus sp. BP-349]|uniref:Hsp70 family protein n=1 Tax=unclassified Rhodococcus (in: high G+C Gram-positive bacteria) TaxID=192944 RepID=UPI001C9AEDE8|nr:MULTISPECIES: Hsp70 family protein [unclassified Rhodococcus (in: high G+C Gram-positive bacteria)]MBY6537460.1 Hsp70 family protein [Rhodococcus sp. BP-363]MBY6541797.1 Hsp70 family protein [Rhodococcus sp. BP-369]MBY6561027.1 Hsp70 family protein [Rhodococcus sp. BP-370]MBY6575319.1 Hsp70 family protein [Rhodococcus sp. BP-364]MBY6584620.1 Hsp70 family protein [Rhodococcus sp. BP-358]